MVRKSKSESRTSSQSLSRDSKLPVNSRTEHELRANQSLTVENLRSRNFASSPNGYTGDYDSILSPSSPAHHAKHRLSSPDVSRANVNLTKAQRKSSRSWLLLITALVLWISILFQIGYNLHWKVPNIKESGWNKALNDNGTSIDVPVFSERIARDHIHNLVTKIGLRVVGTKQEDEAKQYLLSQLNSLKAENDNKGLDRFIENFEIDVQIADGSHRFDLMGFPIIKAYNNITNIIVKLSCGLHCDNNGAILINAHYDSTIVSPGASDDGAGIAIMLEVVRILVNKNKSSGKLKNSLILLFNGAEETLQDASHAFVTQHTLSKNVKGLINLEAMGQNGREILFQANSLEMVKAYSHVPHPHGSVLSNDVFRTGLVLSDTDFRQFIDYGDYVGLDLAFYQNSYYYHTMLDIAENIGKGSIQNFGDNIIAMLDYLLFEADAKDITKNENIIYFDFLGFFFVYATWATAVKVYYLVLFLAVISLYISYKCDFNRLSSFLKVRSIIAQKNSINESDIRKTVNKVLWKSRIYVTVAYIIGFLLALIFNLSLAGIAILINRRMTWFANELYPLVFLIGPSLLGMIIPHIYVRNRILKRDESVISDFIYTDRFDRVIYEKACLDAFIFIPAIFLVISIVIKLGSSYIFSLYLTFICVVSIISNLLSNKFSPVPSNDLFDGLQEQSLLEVDASLKHIIPAISLVTYFVNLLTTIITTELICCITYLFTPITGRIGPDAPTDIIISVIVSGLMNVLLYSVVPLVYRAPRKYCMVLIKHLILLTAIVQVFFLLFVKPFDQEHPKRIYVSYLENPETGNRTINIAHADPVLIHEVLDVVSKDLGVPAIKRTSDQTDSDWLSLYPFSHFMEGYSFDVSNLAPISPPMSELPQLDIQSNYDKSTDSRNITITCYYPNYMWVVFKVEGNVLDWSLSDKSVLKPGKQNKYMIRTVGGYGSVLYKWSVIVKGSEPIPLTVLGVETDGFHELLDIKDHNVKSEKVGLGMRWIWSDRWGSAEILSRIENIVPNWTTGLFVAQVQINRMI